MNNGLNPFGSFGGTNPMSAFGGGQLPGAIGGQDGSNPLEQLMALFAQMQSGAPGAVGAQQGGNTACSCGGSCCQGGACSCGCSACQKSNSLGF